jgi:hypothetical protein
MKIIDIFKIASIDRSDVSKEFIEALTGEAVFLDTDQILGEDLYDVYLLSDRFIIREDVTVSVNQELLLILESMERVKATYFRLVWL